MTVIETLFLDLRGVGPRPRPCHGRVLPLNYRPFGIATLLLPSEHALFYERWTTEPTRSILYCLSALIGCISLILVWGVVRRTFHKHLHHLCMIIFGFSFVAVLVAVYPYMIPPTLTIYGVAASPATLRFMLWGIGPLLPIVLAYNFYIYRVFSDKSPEDRREEY